MSMTDDDKRWLVTTIETVVRDHFSVPVREEMVDALARKLEPVVEGLVRTIIHRDVDDLVRRKVDDLVGQQYDAYVTLMVRR